jgi:membrane dipeptidase
MAEKNHGSENGFADNHARSFPSTKTVLKSIVAGMLVLVGFAWQSGYMTVNIPTPKLTGAEKVLRENPMFDGHNDLLILIRGIWDNHIYNDNFTRPMEEGGMLGQFDFPRADAGLLGGTFWSAWVPCPADGLDFSDAAYAPFVKATLEQIDLFNRLAEMYPKYFTLARTAKEGEENWKQGKLISPLIIEGLHQIGNSLSTLRLYHKLGVRYATLCWNCHNRYADAAVVSVNGTPMASKPYHGGVSQAGRNLILEMNRLGMIVDLSHVSVDTMRDVLAGSPEIGWPGSLAPPIFSHSSTKALCPHPRNVPDDILQLVKKRESVVMINFAPPFVSCRDVGDPSGLPELVEETNTIDHVVEHIMHIGELIGYDYVGIGSDYDGIPNTPRGLEDVSKFPDLINALLAKGVSEEDAGKIAGRNVLRVWHEVDRVAAGLQKTMEPVEDEDDTLAYVGKIDLGIKPTGSK